eukprot:2166200-Amphidinium_carterae.1
MAWITHRSGGSTVDELTTFQYYVQSSCYPGIETGEPKNANEFEVEQFREKYRGGHGESAAEQSRAQTPEVKTACDHGNDVAGVKRSQRSSKQDALEAIPQTSPVPPTKVLQAIAIQTKR